MSNKSGIRKETNLFQFSMFLCVSVGIVFMSQYTVCSDNLVSPYKGLCSIIHCMEFLIDWINVLKNWKCQFFYCNIFQNPIIKSFPKRCFYNGHWQTNDKWLINELWNGENRKHSWYFGILMLRPICQFTNHLIYLHRSNIFENFHINGNCLKWKYLKNNTAKRSCIQVNCFQFINFYNYVNTE